MADDKHFIPGDFYRICQRTGFKVRAGHTRKEWTTNIVRDQSFEMRHPQDFVTGVRDDQTVPDPRPRQVDSFLGPLGTVLTTTFTPGSAPWFLYVDSSVRMSIGDVLRVMCDNGEMIKAIIVDVPNGTTIQINVNLPSRASSGNIVIDYSAESYPILDIGGQPVQSGSGQY